MQSAHQCAQKNSSTGDPLSCAGRRQAPAPRNSSDFSAGAILALKRQQVQILLQSIADRSIAVRPQRRLQQRRAAWVRCPRAASTWACTSQRRPQGKRQVRFGIQRTRLSIDPAPESWSASRKRPPDRTGADRAKPAPSRNRPQRIRGSTPCWLRYELSSDSAAAKLFCTAR